MSGLHNPSEIARETLRQMALRRVPPTPDNYLKFYHEIAGTQLDDEHAPDRFLRSLARRLPRDSAERQRHAHEIDQAIAAGDFHAADQGLSRYLEKLKTTEQLAWNELISSLFRQWNARQTGWTTARKREALDRVLAATDPAALHSRLQGLVRSWQQANSGAAAAGDIDVPAEAALDGSAAAAAPAGKESHAPHAPALSSDADHDCEELGLALRALFVLGLNRLLPPFLEQHSALAAEAALLATAVDGAGDRDALDGLTARITALARGMELAAADDGEIRDGLLDLLRLLLRNVDELVLDDKWLAGQVEMLREIVDGTPTPHALDDAGRRLRSLIHKQGQIKHNLGESQQQLRSMLAGFLDQLAHFADSTGSYHHQLSECAREIADARDIAEIGPMLERVMNETRGMQESARQTHVELLAARTEAQAAERRIAALQNELDEASRQMRHDQLTGALNRRGIEEMFDRERARARRRRSTLSVGVLDIDNFKKLNDTYGHDTGDEALVHLTNVIRQHLRPQDSLARYGGEEFVILLPDAGESDACMTLTRLQRELTRAFFMAGDNRLVITFSAGVAELGTDETMESALKRADSAMYEAKRAGRNRVVASRGALPSVD